MAAATQYIGARYVPYFYLNSDCTNDWRSGVEYEPLTVVTYNGNSYTSRLGVPATVGNPSENPEYWVITGNFNAQLANIISWKDTAAEELEYLAKGAVNVLSLGVKNDGSEDCSTIINNATAANALYFPVGVYRVDAPIQLQSPIYGELSTRMIDNHSSCIKATFGGDSAVVMITSGNDESPITIKNITIDGSDNDVCGFRYAPQSRVPAKLENVSIRGCRDGIDISPSSRTSRSVIINNLSLYGAFRSDAKGSVGVYMNANADDVRINGLTCMYYNVGVENHSFLVLNDAHIYTPNKYILNNTDLETQKDYFASSICINAYAPMMGDNLYLDTALQLFVQRVGKSNLGTVRAQYDSTYNITENRTGTAFRTGDYSGGVDIAALCVGGDLTTVNLILSDTVRVGLMSLNYDIAFYDPSRHGRVSAKGLLISGNSAKIRYDSVSEYKELARLKAAGNGYARISICAGTAKVELNIRVSSVGNCTITKTAGATFDWDLFYKWDGVTLSIYGAHQAGQIRAVVNLLEFGCDADNIGLIDPHMYRMFTYKEQNNTDGLTAIS